MTATSRAIFEEISEFPNPDSKRRFESLVGLDHVKNRLVKEARILLNPKLLEEWSKKHHDKKISLIETLRHRLPLFLFTGDVGTGKTALAESFGDEIARQENIPVTLYRLSLNTRGSGAVGEITRLISEAFKEVTETAKKSAQKNGKSASALILLIDEADALAQSREMDQMHHEDRAGVNALIRGIDNFSRDRLPALVVMCTNRLGAIDPAVQRRAAEIFEFHRPNDVQRLAILKSALDDLGLSDEKLRILTNITGSLNGRSYGYTYSDLLHRLLPTVLLDAFPDNPIEFDRIKKIAEGMVPSPPFKV